MKIIKEVIIVTFICAGLYVSGQTPSVHDPVLAKGENGKFHLFSTGMGVSVKSSDNLHEWADEPPVFDKAPAWTKDSVPGYFGHTWAPDISYHNNLWHLYYSCSTFGKNGSAIGHAVNKTLDKSSPYYKWNDLGAVVVSHRGTDNYNAIDPNVIVDNDGRVWLAFGSFWDGIQLTELSADDYHSALSSPVTIARRRPDGIGTLAEYREEPGVEAGDNAIEAPFVYRHGDWYYLFVSHDYCCRGERSTYKTVYGRSHNVQGPYFDKEGRPMNAGGGTLLYGHYKSNKAIISPNVNLTFLIWVSLAA